MTESSPCPSSFALQRFALRREEGSPEEAGPEEGKLEKTGDAVRRHVSGCAACQRVISEHQAQGDAYMSSPSADALRQKLKGMEDGAARRTGRAGPPVFWAWGGALAVAASVALVLSTAGREGIDELSSADPIESLTAKGSAQLTLWAVDEEETGVQLGEAAVLSPGKRVQPMFAAPSDGFVALVLTTPAGVVVPLVPAGREQSAPVVAGSPAPLGPSFRLDEEVGTYRVTAYFSESSFSTKGLPVQHPKPEQSSFAGTVSTRKFEVRR